MWGPQFDLYYGLNNRGGTISVSNSQTLAFGGAGLSSNTTFIVTPGGLVDLAGTSSVQS